MNPTAPVPAETDLGERRLAAAVHIVSIFAPLWGPLIAWVWQRGKSKFVASHSLQALLETIVLNVCLFTAGLASFIFTLWRLWGYSQNNWEGFNIWEFLIRAGIGWLLVLLLGIVTTIYSIRQAWQALQGQWPKRFRPKEEAAN